MTSIARRQLVVVQDVTSRLLQENKEGITQATRVWTGEVHASAEMSATELALPPELVAAVLSWVSAHDLIRARAVCGQLKRAISQDNNLWSPYLPGSAISACGKELLGFKGAFAFMMAARHPCTDCRLRASPTMTALPFSISPKQHDALHARIEEQLTAVFDATAVDPTTEYLCCVWPTQHGRHAWICSRDADSGPAPSTFEIADSFDMLLGRQLCHLPERAPQLRKWRAVETAAPAMRALSLDKSDETCCTSSSACYGASSELMRFILDPHEWTRLENWLLTSCPSYASLAPMARAGRLEVQLRQQRRAAHIALASAFDSGGLAFLFDLRRGERGGMESNEDVHAIADSVSCMDKRRTHSTVALHLPTRQFAPLLNAGA